ncbi:hypothetical protein BDN70DRAFT_901324 [Pholiota conissans]|uniref:Uncharacterized protein n=1 Tax=Pholiota conissans TaxID=109636 RepID=A0A9P6CRU6_9AGAR|nr:hypothetical protein BDN70DRAFT_901324 [Pholiota conissans]
MSSTNGTTPDSTLSSLGYTADIERSELGTYVDIYSFGIWSLDEFVEDPTVYVLPGLYTVIYFGTIYLYFPATITIQYLASVATFAITWYNFKWDFVSQGDSRDSIFLSLDETTFQLAITLNILSLIILVSGDALLIWRCFSVWGNSVRAIMVPSILIFTEAYENGSVHQAMTKVASAGFIAAESGHTKRRFLNIIDIIVQSGAVYSVTLIMTGASSFIRSDSAFPMNAKLYAFENWLQALVLSISGVSTTVMVARVTTLIDDSNPSKVQGISALEFDNQSRSTSRVDRKGKLSK